MSFTNPVTNFIYTHTTCSSSNHIYVLTSTQGDSLLIPFGMFVYFITYPLILITSPTAILNLSINLFCPVDTALVLTSDDFHSIFPLTDYFD